MNRPLSISAAATFMVVAAIALAVPSAATMPIAFLPDQAERARFQVVAIVFNCLDETWYDVLGSDQVYSVFTSPDGPAVVTRIHRGVDTGDSRSYRPEESCIHPVAEGAQPGNWECVDEGAQAPLAFTVHMFASDADPPPHPFPEECLAATAAEECEDELIGRATHSFTAEQLLEAMPHQGRIYEYTVTLGGPCGHLEAAEECSPGWFQPTGPHYALTYRLVRVQDQEPLSSSPTP